MSNDQTMFEGYAEDFKIGYELALQQIGSRFKDKVTYAPPAKGKAAQVIDHIMPMEAEVGGDDTGDTKWTHASMMPRWAFPRVTRLTTPVTTTDHLSMLEDPSNALTKSVMAGQMRALDKKIIIPAFFRTVTGGADQDKQIAFPASQLVDQNVGGNASGLNRSKIDNCIELFEKAEVDLDMEQPWMAIDPRQHRLARNIAEVSNRDFEKLGGVMEKGRVRELFGCRVFVTNMLTKVVISTVEYLEVPVWVPSGMVVQPWMDLTVKVSERADKNYTTQIYTEQRWDAVRTEEGRVCKVLCKADALPA